MLLLKFSLRNEFYVLEVEKVIEIIPLVNLKHVPGVPEYVAGLMSYRGRPVPVIDLCHLTDGRKARQYYSTRIILIDYQGSSDSHKILGLMVEDVTETVECDESDFVDSGIASNEAPFFSDVTTIKDVIMQRVDIDNILPPEIRNMLFANNSEALTV